MSVVFKASVRVCECKTCVRACVKQDAYILTKRDMPGLTNGRLGRTYAGVLPEVTSRLVSSNRKELKVTSQALHSYTLLFKRVVCSMHGWSNLMDQLDNPHMCIWQTFCSAFHQFVCVFPEDRTHDQCSDSTVLLSTELQKWNQ